MNTEPLARVLEATGYLAEGAPAPGVRLGESARRCRRGRRFAPDASWHGQSALTIYFKYVDDGPKEDLVAVWRHEVWNEGFSPLLWVISPAKIELYNAFGRPEETGDAARHRLDTFENLDRALQNLDAVAGRLVMETGQFWLKESRVDRRTAVDHQLLKDLAILERDLVAANLDRPTAQALIGRSIFAQYLIDRSIVGNERLRQISGHQRISEILRDPAATRLLFDWLGATFNGDMFPVPSTGTSPDPKHLARLADFLEAVDPSTGQTTFFPYQFDIIPVELISSIYEQFAHAEAPALASTGERSEASQRGVYYTRLPLVSLVLDEVTNGLQGTETVLDLTCGSGVFLVEALRRLVALRAGHDPPTRELIRSTLYGQVYGVDISEAAIRIAAFSLYLAALELDPDPQPPEALRFRPLIGQTLFIGDAHSIETTKEGRLLIEDDGGVKKFDLIVGNPPWTFKGLEGTAQRRRDSALGPAQPRGESLDFVQRALTFAHDRTRFGLIVSATPFFSASSTGTAAALHVVRSLSPVTLVDLSRLTDWLFPGASMPALALLARHRPQPHDQLTVVRVPWSPSGTKSHTFQIAPSDVTAISLAEWEQQSLRLKAAASGTPRDLLLLDNLKGQFASLEQRLVAVGTKLRVGLTLGTSGRKVSALSALEFLQADDLRRFWVPLDLPLFGDRTAERPRTRDAYRAPLVLVKEFLSKGPRPVTAVTDRDVVFTKAFYGASFPADREAADLVAGLLSSSFASWFFITTSAEFGLWKRRLLLRDITRLPAPELRSAVSSKAGKRIIEMTKGFGMRPPDDDGWAELDNTVLDLYGLDATDRIVIRDGLVRASWEWEEGRWNSAQPSNTADDLAPYAGVFLGVIDAWLSARNQRSMRAEILDLPDSEAFRVVRFVLEQRPGPSVVDVVTPDVRLSEVLSRIGKRLRVPVASALVGQRELRVHGRDEVVIIKPAAKRHWMGVSALRDADAVIAESLSEAPN